MLPFKKDFCKYYEKHLHQFAIRGNRHTMASREEERYAMYIDQENGVIQGSVKVDGNLEVGGQLAAREFKVVGEDHLPMFTTAGDKISFRQAVEFKDNVEFTNGRTIIGKETTYNSAYVGTETIQAGKRVVVGDSFLKIDADTRSVIADTFKMTLARLDVDNLISKRQIATAIDAKTLKVSGELIGNNIFADTIKTNKLYLDTIGSRSLNSTETMTVKDLIVGGTATFENDVTINGKGVGPNGAALVINGGGLVANWGIVSHTSNNKFQTMQITGSGKDHEICFHVDRNYDSLFEGDVTIDHSKLILDNSRLVSDDIVVTSFNEIKADEPMSGVQMTTRSNWETYKDGMVVEMDAEQSAPLETYNPIQKVQDASERTRDDYNNAGLPLKDLITPINYLMEDRNSDIPKRFSVKSGVYRVDSSGNALIRNLVAETAKFSKLDAYKFNVNRLSVDKLVTTAVASNVVHTDSLLKSDGIAEFDGAVNVKGDVFVENDSNVDVADGASMTFRSGSSLKIQNGAIFEMGRNTTVKMGGDVEIDLANLVFVDSTTGSKYKISFRDAHECEGTGVVMEYHKVLEESETSDVDVVQRGQLDAKELDKKLKTLGI